MLFRELKKYQQLWFDISFLIILAGIVYLLIHVYANLIVPFKPVSSISLSPVSLAAYSLYSLIRMLAAYLLSLGFALGYGYCAARTRFGEVLLVPLLDILQSIPGVTFDQVWANRVESFVDETTPAHFISRDDLIANKLAVGRGQDLVDVEKMREAASARQSKI